MGDLKVSEAFEDRVFITLKNGSDGVTGLSPACVIVDESGNRSSGTVTEQSSGWYVCTVTPDAEGSWATEWSIAGSYTIYYPFKLFKVGGGRTEDNYTALVAVEGLGFATATDSLKVLSDNIDAIKAKTDNLPVDPADDSDLDVSIAAIAGKVDDLEGRLTADRATKLDNLDAAITTCAPSATALTNATWTDARAGYVDELAAANLPADVDTLKTRVGDPSGDTLISLTAKLGDSASSLVELLAALNTALTFQHQTTINSLNEDVTQNTWYTVLDTTANVRLIHAGFKTSVAEDLELKITTSTGTLTCTASAGGDTFQYPIIHTGTNTLGATTTDPGANRAFLLEDRSVKVEVRKTSANDAGSDLTVRVQYAKR